MRVHFDRFDSAEHLTGKKRTYDTVKEAVLAAGRFSCFEATEDPNNFTNLCHDRELETWEMGYPWTGVRRRQKVEE